MRNLIVLLGIALLLPGCYYDVEEELYPYTGNCDTASVQYSATIVPIIQSGGCLGCHSGSTPSGNILLETYAQVKSLALNGRLIGAISHSAGYSPMPQGGNKLSECNINRIRAWINEGAQEN